MARTISNPVEKAAVINVILTRANQAPIKIDEALYQELGTGLWSQRATFCVDVAKYAAACEYIVDQAKKAGTWISRSAATPANATVVIAASNATPVPAKKQRKSRITLTSADYMEMLINYIAASNEVILLTDDIITSTYGCRYNSGHNFLSNLKSWYNDNFVAKKLPVIHWQNLGKGGSYATANTAQYHALVNGMINTSNVTKLDTISKTKTSLKAAKRQAVYTALKAIIMQSQDQVCINDVFESINEIDGVPVFTNALYFGTVMREFMIVDTDVNYKSIAPFGTIAAKQGIDINLPYKQKTEKKKVGRKQDARFAEMFIRIGQAPIKFRGTPVTVIIDQENWKKCKSVPKTFARPEVKEVWRQESNGQAIYLTIDSTGQQYKFVQL